MCIINYKNKKKLRCGFTTGSCAAGAAGAAAELLLTGKIPECVKLTTPTGLQLTLKVEEPRLTKNSATCGVRKDAGDDPDVTRGILILASVQKAQSGVTIEGGCGIGRVTKPGLSVPVGAAAINPVPLREIAKSVRCAAEKSGYTGGFKVTISAPGGELIAPKTRNPQLGIEGGISILGTTGIVEPMSERALLDSIRLELESLFAQGIRTALLCPGNYGLEFAREHLGLELERGIKCSNFIGDTLDHAAYLGFSDVLLVGHAGKLVKLAAGVMNTHSSVADARKEIITAHAALCGAKMDVLDPLMRAASIDAMVELLEGAGLRERVFYRVGAAVQSCIEQRLKGSATRAEFIMFTGRYGLLAQSSGADNLCKRLRGII